METFSRIIALMLFCLFPITGFAQQDNHYPDWHNLSVEERLEYNSNPQRMLPDARTAFQGGDYGKALMICSMHFVIYGDESAETGEKNELESKSKKCYDLLAEMQELLTKGPVSEAKKRARAIIDYNAQDKKALDVLLLDEPAVQPQDTTPAPKPEPKPEQKPEPKPEPEPVHVTGLHLSKENLSITEGGTAGLTASVTPYNAVDKTVVWSSDNIRVATIDPTGMVRAIAPGSAVITARAGEGKITARCKVTVEPKKQPVQRQPAQPAAVKPTTRHTRFVAKAGAAYFKGLSPAISPAAALGLYDIGGSRVGLEAGGSFLRMRDISLSMVLNLSNTVYLRAGAGYFSCASTTSSSTTGLNAVAGVNFILGRHFCLDLEAAYYPTVRTMGSESVSTAGTSYQMPVVVTLMKAGIAPSIKIGWAF